MKKGLLNLIVLILVITNVALTAILVFAVVPAMNATTELVGKVAKAIDLEKELQDQANESISIDNIATFTFEEEMTILLKQSEDGRKSYAKFSVTLTLNKEDEAYEKYKDELSNMETLMRTEINRIVADHTADELANDKMQVADEIRDALRKMFNETQFIHSVGFSDFVIQ